MRLLAVAQGGCLLGEGACAYFCDTAGMLTFAASLCALAVAVALMECKESR